MEGRLRYASEGFLATEASPGAGLNKGTAAKMDSAAYGVIVCGRFLSSVLVLAVTASLMPAAMVFGQSCSPEPVTVNLGLWAQPPTIGPTRTEKRGQILVVEQLLLGLMDIDGLRDRLRQQIPWGVKR
jgi:hypothetical protein